MNRQFAIRKYDLKSLDATAKIVNSPKSDESTIDEYPYVICDSLHIIEMVTGEKDSATFA
jgi:hypothetical protein